MSDSKKFMYLESNQIPLKEIPYGNIKEKLIDPTTNKPYVGIVLEGVFASLKQKPNNNKRIYDNAQYLILLQNLKKQILTSKGVYGELEHPETYSVNFNNVSHKILDVWYDEETETVYGKVILLNTPKGLIAQEIVKSGGQLAISARAAGEEIQQNDGTYKAITKVLTTYDLVYHPGFSSAVLGYVTLNESQQFIQRNSENKEGFGILIYENNFKKLSNKYKEYIQISNLNESEIVERKSKCFLEYFSLNESEEQDVEILEKNEPSDEDEKQKQLEIATQKDLKENFMQELFFQQIDCSIHKLRKNNRLDATVYDDSAGFLTTEP